MNLKSQTITNAAHVFLGEGFVIVFDFHATIPDALYLSRVDATLEGGSEQRNFKAVCTAYLILRKNLLYLAHPGSGQQCLEQAHQTKMRKGGK